VDGLSRLGPADEELVAGVGRRDEAAFQLLYERYADLVYSVALRVLADEAAAQDVAQDVFVRLWQNSEKYDPDRGRFMGWLLSVARNRAVDEVRSRGRRRGHERATTDQAEELVDLHGIDPAWAAIVNGERRAVVAALAGLPHEQREAIELAYYGGLTQQEIAIRLKTPLGTVKTRVRLGMRKLRATLEPVLRSTNAI
jgi:RNA polymerase sigma-70 factor (ECF subfamily)